MRSTLSFGIGLSALGAVLAASPVAYAQVDCSNPDNLCTGDPCVIPAMEVQDPCVVDFGSRSLVIAETLRAPGAGTVSFRARAITIQGSIRGELSTPGFGTRLSLSATGDIEVQGPIRTSHSSTITLDAGGNIGVQGPISQGKFGRITLDAGGNIRVEKSMRQGEPSVIISLTASGDINVESRVRGAAEVTLDAGGFLAVSAGMRVGPVTLHGVDGVRLERVVRARVHRVARRVAVWSSAGDVDIWSVVGGRVTISSLTGNVVIRRQIDASADLDSVEVEAPGLVTLSGSIRAVASGTVRITGGTVEANRARINTSGSSRYGPHGGKIFMRATAGNLTLRGFFVARPWRSGLGRGGTIEARAAGDLTASGAFRCAGLEGCIALSAGGTLDTTGGTFDVPLSPDCPGSPSGAFLDGSDALLE